MAELDTVNFISIGGVSKSIEDTTAREMAENAKSSVDGKLDKTGDAADVITTFTQAGTRANLTSKEKLSVSLGKIMKWFADLKGLAFKDSVSKSDLDTALQAELAAAANKQDAITGGASTITSANLTANRALLSDASGKVAVSAVTNTQLGYLSGVTSAIQAQLNARELSANKGVANGYAGLDSNAKLFLASIPDFVLGQKLDAGTFNAATAVATLTTNAQTKLGTSNATLTLTNNTVALTGYASNQGNFYIVSAGGTFAGISFDVGDWLVATAAGWGKIDNTDALTGIKGEKEATFRIGNVNITCANIGAEPAIAAGTAAQYLNGTKTWTAFDTSVRGAKLTGFSDAADEKVLAADTVLVGMGKLQGQLNKRAPLPEFKDGGLFF